MRTARSPVVSLCVTLIPAPRRNTSSGRGQITSGATSHACMENSTVLTMTSLSMFIGMFKFHPTHLAKHF